MRWLAVALSLLALSGCGIKISPVTKHLYSVELCSEQAAKPAGLEPFSATTCKMQFGGCSNGFVECMTQLEVRFIPPVQSANTGEVHMDLYPGGVQREEDVEREAIVETGLPSFGYPIMHDIGVEGRPVVFVPLGNPSADSKMAVWASDFPERSFIRVGEIPSGRIIRMTEDAFIVSSSSTPDEWTSPLLRVSANGVETLGTLDVKRTVVSQDEETCSIDDNGVLKQIGIDREIEQDWLCYELQDKEVPLSAYKHIRIPPPN